MGSGSATLKISLRISHTESFTAAQIYVKFTLNKNTKKNRPMNPLPSPEGGAGAGTRGLLPSLQVGQRLQDIPAQQYSHRSTNVDKYKIGSQ